MVGLMDGRSMYQMRCSLVAPSMMAASCIWLSTPASAEMYMIALQPMPCHTPENT